MELLERNMSSRWIDLCNPFQVSIVRISLPNLWK